MRKLKLEDALIEIHTEELPPKALSSLATHFCESIQKKLIDKEFKFKSAEWFATPRRLSVRLNQLTPKQADTVVERRGPAWSAAYDASGQPTPACVGFARSCNTSVEKLITLENPQGKWVGFKQAQKGQSIHAILPEVVQDALNTLPIPKRMRWNSGTVEFVRPVHSVILLYGTKVIPATVLGCKTGQMTSGHRFLCKTKLKITKPSQYESILAKKGYVLVDFADRKEKIARQTRALVKKKLGQKAKVLMSDALLDEVTGLVEWPVALLGQFDQAFLEVPQEALISAMQDHQRYFPVLDAKGKLLPYFVVISNIDSRDKKQVIAGNERVLRARLSDAAFFFEMDKKITLLDRVEKLNHVMFQAKLGTLGDKAERLAKLMKHIASKLNMQSSTAERIGLLLKTDLTTTLVGEFPELQGIAGYYYALHDGEGQLIASAIKEHYQPRFSGDVLPESPLGVIAAIADRLDTLVGIFGVNLIPTGDKDPFGLRRAAVGLLRLLIEKKLPLDIEALLNEAYSGYSMALPNQTVVKDVWQFMQERLKPWYIEQGVTADIIQAVSAMNLTNPYDMDCRIQAVRAFKAMPEATALSIANKRVSNILTQAGRIVRVQEIDLSLFEHEAESVLAAQLTQFASDVANLSKVQDYQAILKKLARLRKPVDDFFDHVMVMTEDERRKENRLLMLKKLREQFLQVADIALLQ